MPLITDPVRKIAVFRALQLGDLLCAIPAIRALRNHFPEAHITLVGLPWSKSLVNRFPQYFNSFIHFPGYPGLPEQPVQPAAFTSFLQGIQTADFDLAIQMHGNGTLINPMVELFGAKITAGFCLKDDYCPGNGYFMEYPNGIHEIERHLRLMQYLGISSQGSSLEFPLTSKDKEEYTDLELPVKAKRYVCIHPGSRGSWRQWPPENFAALGDYSIQQGFQVVITGTEAEHMIVNEVIKHMKYKPIIVAGKTTLGAVGVLIKNAFALICNCTGVSHMASAFETPAVIISMDGEPERWGPLNKDIHFTIDWTRHADFDLVFNQTKALLNRGGF